MEMVVYPSIGNNLPYTILGLIEEFAEFQLKLADLNSSTTDLINEAGDVYWYSNAVILELGLEFEDVLLNIDVMKHKKIHTKRQ